MLKLTAKDLRARALDGAVNSALGVGTFALLSKIENDGKRRLAAKVVIAAGGLGIFGATGTQIFNSGRKTFGSEAVLTASTGAITGGVLSLLYKKL